MQVMSFKMIFRPNCGRNEASDFSGAVHIPGTPKANRSNSFKLAYRGTFKIYILALIEQTGESGDKMW